MSTKLFYNFVLTGAFVRAFRHGQTIRLIYWNFIEFFSVTLHYRVLIRIFNRF